MVSRFFYLSFFTETFHFTGSRHLDKEEGRDYPASTLTPGGKQALRHSSSMANKENALKLFKNASAFSQNCHHSEN